MHYSVNKTTEIRHREVYDLMINDMSEHRESGSCSCGYAGNELIFYPRQILVLQLSVYAL